MPALDLNIPALQSIRDRSDVSAFEVKLIRLTSFPLTATLAAEPHPGLVIPFDVPFPVESLQPELSAQREQHLTVLLGPRDCDVGGIGIEVTIEGAWRVESCNVALVLLTLRDPRGRKIAMHLAPSELQSFGRYWCEPARLTIGRLTP